MTHLLIPGRHHLLTSFQSTYIGELLRNSLEHALDVQGQPLGIHDRVEDIIFAVTSANHSNTRRNPLPLYLRAMQIGAFTAGMHVRSLVVDVNDLPNNPDFARYTLRQVEHRIEGLILKPENTVVVCSTPVMELYERLGFRILPAELKSRNGEYTYKTPLPWEIVEAIASDPNWRTNPLFLKNAHPASQRIWKDYNLGDKVSVLFHDRMVGDDSDLTETRDYTEYVRALDENVELKWKDTSPFVRPGRIGDIGCGVGSWTMKASHDARFRESDFYGIDISARLFEICEQRRSNRDFGSDYVFFSRRNAVTGTVFTPNSMNTIHTGSLTHEIESYGGRLQLEQFIQRRFDELVHGGVWINRDVVGPENKDQIVYMRLNTDDGRNTDWERHVDTEHLPEYLAGLSTFAVFLRFAQDFRHEEGYQLPFEIVEREGSRYIKLRMQDACEFMSKKDYTDNWESEMHETFCFWDIQEWKAALESRGFHVLPESHAYANPWVVANRYEGKAALFREHQGTLQRMEFPVTNMLLIGEKL